MADKPDGFVAWHPVHGPAIESLAEDLNLIGTSWMKVVTETMKTEDAGWRIRPVKLVFLDEDKKDDR